MTFRLRCKHIWIALLLQTIGSAAPTAPAAVTLTAINNPAPQTPIDMGPQTRSARVDLFADGCRSDVVPAKIRVAGKVGFEQTFNVQLPTPNVQSRNRDVLPPER